MESRSGRRYRLISADSHVNEPPDLWTARVPAALRDRVPRIERFEEGDAWVLEGVADPINFGMNACAGLAPEEMKRVGPLRGHPRRRLRPGRAPRARWTPTASTPRCCTRRRASARGSSPTPTPTSTSRASPAYNDWLSEYVAEAPERFGGLALLPNCGVEHAVAEIDRVIARPGIRGVLIGCYPNGTLEPTPEDDKVWARVVEAGVPVSIHVSLSRTMPAAHKAKLPGYGRFFDAPNRMIELIFSGVFDRFPELEFVFAEVDCGWVPYVKEQIDNNFHRLDPVSRFGLQRPPSEYIERHFHFGFMTDTFGIRNRHDVGVERILWSSDYPHISADWPNSWRTIQAAFSGVPADERELILAGNARRLYGFGS